MRSGSPSREAIARLDLALAHAQLGDLDVAAHLGGQALAGDRIVTSVRTRAGDLDRYLRRRAHRTVPRTGRGDRTAPRHQRRRDLGKAAAMTEQPTKTMTIYKQYFDLIKAGKKTIEVRVAYPKNKNLAAGQILRFVSGDDTLDTSITKVSTYDSFEALADAEDIEAMAGGPETRDELIKACREIYPPAKEALGVLAIHLKVIDEPSASGT